MANISQLKREKMIAFLNQLKETHQDDDSLRAIGEIEQALNEKKYGLVWEKHTENVDEMLKHHIPVFVEDEDKKISYKNVRGGGTTFYWRETIYTRLNY